MSTAKAGTRKTPSKEAMEAATVILYPFRFLIIDSQQIIDAALVIDEAMKDKDDDQH